MRRWIGSALVQMMAWRLLGAKPLSYYQCWVIVNWTLRNKLQWNFVQNTKLFIHKNAFENIICEMAAILSRGWWVKQQTVYPTKFAHNLVLSNPGVYILSGLVYSYGIYTHILRCPNVCEANLKVLQQAERDFKFPTTREKRPALLAFCEGNPLTTDGFPAQRGHWQ